MFSLRFFAFIAIFFVFGATIFILYFVLGGVDPVSFGIGIGALIFAAALFSMLFTIGIARPLRRIRQSIYEVQKGNYNVRIEGKFPGEIDEFVQALNKAIERVKKDKEEIEEARATLEIRVRARTHELQELANSLEKKVEDRTKEIQAKVEEMERFQKLAVGRELKMIELKREIEELTRKIAKK